MNVCLISLGCAKNQVNSEQMLFRLSQAGVSLTDDPSIADVNVVNTCSFIESARQEAVDQILELTAHPGKILVAGCLTQMVQEEIFTEIPEVSGILGCGSYDQIVPAVEALARGERYSSIAPLPTTPDETQRIPISPEGAFRTDGLLPSATAFLKISEGCSRACTYCTIPSIRGKQVSRDIPDIVKEAQWLVSKGVRELILIAQDLTSFGKDSSHGNLEDLLEALCAIEDLEWIRLHYLYPGAITKRLINLVRDEDKILKYLDIPIQHSETEILKLMGRQGTGESIRDLLFELRSAIPKLVIRTTLITGFPGETEELFEKQCEFLSCQKIERVGVFVFSPEPGTVASELPNPVPEEVALHRQEVLLDIQESVMEEFDEYRIGQTLRVLCEGYDRLAGTYYARSYAESVDVDGKIFFSSSTPITPGTFCDVLVEESFEGELFGSVISEQEVNN